MRLRLISLLFILFFISIFLTLRYERFASKRHYADFHVYYVTGQRVLAGKSIYVDETDKVTPFKYSPLIASFFSLLSNFNEKISAGIWHWTNLLFLFGSAAIGSQLAQTLHNTPDNRLTFWISVLGFTGVSPPLVHCLNSGQVGIAILFCYVLGIYFASQGRDLLGGLCLALSCMFKYLPILVLPYFLFQKKQKLFFLMVLWLLILHLLPAFWFGWNRNFGYLTQFLPFLTDTTLDHISLLDFKNQSVWAYLYRLIFYDLGFFEIQRHPKLILIIGLALFSIFYWIVISKTKQEQFVLGCAMLSILIVIFNPNAWKHNFVLLLFPYQILIGSVFSFGWRNWKTAALTLASFLLFISNRSLVGWGGRFELMSLSILMLSALTLFSAMAFGRKSQPTI